LFKMTRQSTTKEWRELARRGASDEEERISDEQKRMGGTEKQGGKGNWNDRGVVEKIELGERRRMFRFGDDENNGEKRGEQDDFVPSGTKQVSQRYSN
jgi:hypothetical protein